MPRGQPVYLTLNPDGTVGAAFSGQLSAAGIDIIAGVSASPPNTSRIQWHKTNLSGAVVAEVFGYSTTATDGGFNSVSKSPDGTRVAGISSTSRNTGAPGDLLNTQVIAVAAPENRIVLNGAGGSNFLQMPNANKSLITFGTGACTFTAAKESALGTQAHGLGVVPQVVIATCLGGSLGIVIDPRWDNGVTDAVNFGMRMESDAAFSATINYAWIAIG